MEPSETWTPIFDALVDRLGLLSAAVYGIVWRYCRMRDGVCKASLDTIADRARLSKWTVYRHLASLEKEGFIRDLSPELRNAPHVYECTNRLESLKYEEVAQGDSGLSQSQSSEVEGVAESQCGLSQSQPSEDGGVAQYQPRLALSQRALSQSQPGLSQSQPSEGVGVAESQCVLSQSQRGSSTVTMPGVAESQLSKTLLRDSLRETVKIRASPEEIWKELVGQFQATKTERSTWLESAVPLAFDPQTHILTIGIHNSVASKWILDHQPKSPIVIRCTTIA